MSIKISDAILEAVSLLKNDSYFQDKDCFLEAKLLMRYLLNMTNEQFFLQKDKLLQDIKYKQYLQLIDRRLTYEPISYIIGAKEFYGRDFIVDKNILIPRNDTEILVDEVINFVDTNYDNQKNISILELGVGSGAIITSLACEFEIKNQKNINFLACDISPNALKLAKTNIIRYNMEDKITLCQSNWFDNDIIKENNFDIIISNPPYISRDEEDLISKETMLHEPHIALFANNDGLEFFEHIIKNSIKYFKDGEGVIFLEIGFKQYDKIHNLLIKYGFDKIKLIKDLSGHDRVIKATKLKI